MANLNEELKKLSARIKKFRVLKNIQRKDIASKLDMTVSGYSKIERGEVDITFGKILQIAKLLDIGFNELMNIEQQEVFNISNYTNHGSGIGGAGKVVFNSQLDEKLNNYISYLEEEVIRLKK
jgi:transcriptional regulator with XRE-family HTH domain